MERKDAGVVKYLLERKGQTLNMRSISLGLKMDYKVAYGIIKRLEKEKVVILEKFGNSATVRLSDKVSPLIFEAETQRREELLKNKNLRLILDYYEKGLGTRFYVLLLFGSFAKGTQKKNSDIDLLFVVPDGREEEFERKIQNISATIPFDIHVNVFSEKDFRAMGKSKEPTVGSEAIMNNMILHGIESYYGLIG
jgi:predicted nucleotidyltransferase